MDTLRQVLRFAGQSLRLLVRGTPQYYAWTLLLLALAAIGAGAFAYQVRHGFISTNMRDQVSWGFYIGNFAFLVGVAAAAVMLVIPAYIYHWKPIKEISIFGELLAISAIVMALLFVIVDIGRPERFWHLMPGVGLLNWPRSMLSWDVLVVGGYLVLNLVIVFYLLYNDYMGREYNKRIAYPLVILSIPAAVSIHTVTAYLFNGLAARPFWNTALLAPRFLSSAFCSGPAILLILLQILRRNTKLDIEDAALRKIAELMAYTMGFYLFMTGAEAFKEFYSNTEEVIFIKYLYFGVKGHTALVPFAWASVLCGVAAFLLFLIPRTRTNWTTMNIGCVLIFASVFIEKGMGLIIPGMTPDVLGEIYEYTPAITELLVATGILALGFLVWTLMLKVAVPILLGEFRVDRASSRP